MTYFTLKLQIVPNSYSSLSKFHEFKGNLNAFSFFIVKLNFILLNFDFFCHKMTLEWPTTTTWHRKWKKKIDKNFQPLKKFSEFWSILWPEGYSLQMCIAFATSLTTTTALTTATTTTTDYDYVGVLVTLH